MINPPGEIKRKIDANLLNLTGLVTNGYLDNNLTSVIIQSSGAVLGKTTDNPILTDPTYNVRRLYSSKNADSRMGFLAARLDYSSIIELAENPSVSYIWLDRKFQACLDQSVRIVKNPLEWGQIEQSWGRSVNGSGVKIAILDTGIDPTHPDFNFPNGTSKIVSAISFTGESTSDGSGHGTHCASIAAGTGAASSGQYVGVAPGGALMNVKVLGNNDQGEESWVISGIQWAVDNGANVLSMSFATSLGGNGSDPMSTTVNWATNHGAVCVVAAGNFGPDMYSIGTPAVAELAITVGASTKDDVMASFSSRGPTSDRRIKPDLVAPGVDIVAARAAGTNMGTPISQYYTKASGTSMATPHVAGAAALLLDAHPNWDPITIRMTLANNAQNLSATVFDQGTGRLNVCKAATAMGAGNSSLSFGRVSLNTLYKQVFIIKNLKSQVINARLDVKTWHISDGTPYNVASLNTSDLTLAVGATGKVEISLSTSGSLPTGYFEGRINAAISNTSIGIPFFFCILSQLNVQVVDETGQNLKAAFVLIDAGTTERKAFLDECNNAEFTMMPGLYVIQAMNIYALQPSGSFDTRISFLVHKKFSIGTGETINMQLSLGSAYKLDVRSTDITGSPLHLARKRLFTSYYTMDYISSTTGTFNTQLLYLTNISEYMKPPCLFGFSGFPQDYDLWKASGTLMSEVDAYFIGWDISKFGLSPIQAKLDYTNPDLATFYVENTLSKPSATSKIWFNQMAGLWQTGVWHGFETHPGILWRTHVLPCQYKSSPSSNWADLEWSCLYVFSTTPDQSPEQFVIDRHFQPITKGENASYRMGKTPLLPQDVISDPPYCGNGLYVPYYPLRVEKNLYISKTDPQATKRLEVFQNSYLRDNETKAWAQAPIPISQFLNSYGYGLYSFVVKTDTSLNYSSKNVAEYTINYTSTSTDLIPPSITRIDCNPCFTSNEHQVNLQLADNDRIAGVSLLYSTDNGPYLPSNLNNLGNNTFSANLILPAGTQRVSLIIETSDGNGNKIRFTIDPAALRGFETRVDANLNGGTITGRLTVIAGSLIQPLYLNVKSNGQTMYTLTDAYGNFAFSVPSYFGFRIEIAMESTGNLHGSSWAINFLQVQTEPAGVALIPGQGWYTQGASVVLTAPESLNVSYNTRYRFSYWDVDGTSRGSGVNPITVNGDTNHTATAHFTIQYYLTVSVDPAGIVSIPGEGWYDGATSRTLTAPQISNYQFNYWSIDGSSQGNQVNPITVSMNTAHLATAHYIRTTPTVNDITIVNVATFKTIVGQGFSTHVNVTVANHGNVPENFNVTIYANQTIIATRQNVVLASGNVMAITLTWNTSGFVKGNYSISAYAWPVPGETNVADNNFTDGWVFISMVGDINADGKVDAKDVYIAAQAYGSRPGYPYWNANCDINDDGTSDLKDYYIVCKNYGKSG
jgi:serine protease AprX